MKLKSVRLFISMAALVIMMAAWTIGTRRLAAQTATTAPHGYAFAPVHLTAGETAHVCFFNHAATVTVSLGFQDALTGSFLATPFSSSIAINTGFCKDFVSSQAQDVIATLLLQELTTTGLLHVASLQVIDNTSGKATIVANAPQGF